MQRLSTASGGYGGFGYSYDKDGNRRYEDFAAEPLTLMRYGSIGEVAACVQQRKSGLCGWAVQDHVLGVEQ